MVIDSIQVMQWRMFSHRLAAWRRCVKRRLTDALRQNARRGDCHGWARNQDGSLAGPKVLEHCIDCSVLLMAMPTPVFAPYAAIKTASARE